MDDEHHDDDDDGRAAIIADYLQGVTVPDLARQHHRTNRTIARILRDAGVAGTLQRRASFARRGRPSLPHLRGPGLGSHPSGAQWAYIAGFFDGEGSIDVRKAADAGSALAGAAPSCGHHVRFRVSVVQKNSAPLAWFREQLGAGAIHVANGTHRYQLQSQRAVFEFLLGVHRFLVVKRAKAEAALAALAASYGWDIAGTESGSGYGSRRPSCDGEGAEQEEREDREERAQ